MLGSKFKSTRNRTINVSLQEILKTTFITGCVTFGINAIHAGSIDQCPHSSALISGFAISWVSAWIIALPISLLTGYVAIPVVSKICVKLRKEK